MNLPFYPRPIVGTDVMIFAIRDGQLKVLLVQREGEPYRGRWTLPGGFVRVDEDIEECATRELLEQTGVCGVKLEQLYTFGRVTRDLRERVISVAHYALISHDKAVVRPATRTGTAGWFSLDALPNLAFDHGEIVAIDLDRAAENVGGAAELPLPKRIAENSNQIAPGLFFSA